MPYDLSHPLRLQSPSQYPTHPSHARILVLRPPDPSPDPTLNRPPRTVVTLLRPLTTLQDPRSPVLDLVVVPQPPVRSPVVLPGVVIPDYSVSHSRHPTRAPGTGVRGTRGPGTKLFGLPTTDDVRPPSGRDLREAGDGVRASVGSHPTLSV